VHPSSGKSWQWLPYLPCGHQHGATSAGESAVFSHTKYVSDVVKTSLIDAYVLHIMTYALEDVSLTRGQYDEHSVCWNNWFRRIFNIRKWESVKLNYNITVAVSISLRFAGYPSCVECQVVRM